MGKPMIKGANLPVTAAHLRVVLTWSWGQRTPDLDLSASLLTAAGTVRAAEDVLSYRRPATPDGHVRHLGKTYLGRSTSTDTFVIDLRELDPAVDRVAFSALADDGSFRRVADLRLRLYEGPALVARFDVTDATDETVLVLGELYRRAGAWRFRAVGQGYTDGLAGLAAEHGFRVDVSMAAKLARAANRRRTRITELAAATAARCGDDLRRAPTPTHGLLRPGRLTWRSEGHGPALTTEQLVATENAVPVEARLELMDQIGTVVDGVEARVTFTEDALERTRLPEDRILAVSFLRTTLEATPTAPAAANTGVAPTSGPRPDPGPGPDTTEQGGTGWLSRWLRSAPSGTPSGTPPGTPPGTGAGRAGEQVPASPAGRDQILAPVRAVLARVVLPEPARQELESLCQVLVRNLELADQLTMSEKARHTLARAADTYLPDCLTSYADAKRLLPAGQLLRSGRTMDDELLHALRVTRELVDSTMEDAEREAATSLLVMSEFLEGKRRE